MSKAQGLRLAHVNALHVVGFDASHHFQQLLLTRLFKGYLQLESHVKVVFNRALVATRHEDHFSYAGGICFFDGVLNQGFVDNRQHFLRLGLGGRKKTRAKTSHWKDRFVDQHLLTISCDG